MADVTDSRLGLVEVVKRHDPNGNLATIAEVLAKTNSIIGDAVWKEGNDIFSNKTVRRSSLPSGTWRKLNRGVASESSDTVELIDTIGILETRAENDVEIINAFSNPQQARMDEASAFMEGLSQEMAATMIYGNAATAPEEFTGLAPRLDALAATANVIGGGGSTTLTSIYVVSWGVNTVYMAYPRNTSGGLQHEDLGIQDALDSSSNKFRAYVDRFVWRAGMVVKHPKAIARYANLEPTGTTTTFDEDELIRLLNRMVTGPGTAIYCGTEMMTQMQIRLKDKSNVYFTRESGLDGGGPVLRFNGFPVRKCEAILDSETAIS
jgi:hypothetical protein